jgi:predicted acylesterase/phospholipase RssA/ankyrin repeat protein
MTPPVASKQSMPLASLQSQPSALWVLLATALGLLIYSTTNPASGAEEQEVSYEDLKTVSKLFQIDLPADKNAAMGACFKAVFDACKNGNWGPIELLADLKNDILGKLVDSQGRNLLSAAVDGYHYEMAQALLDKFKNISFNTPDRDGNNALHIAVRNGSLRLVELLSRTCDKNLANHQYATPVHLAIISNRPDILDYFLKLGATPPDISVKKMKLSLLQLAIYHGRASCMDILIERRKASFDHCPQEGGNILHWLIHCGHSELLRELFSKYSDRVKPLLESPDDAKRTPLSLASLKGDIQAIKFLHEKGASLEAQDNQGRRPFYLAALGKQEEAMEWLVFLGADPEKADQTNTYPVNIHPTGSRTRVFIENLIGIKNAPPSQRTTQFHPLNLVFQGGGPKNVAYAAVIEELEQQKMLQELKRVAGTSAGAITATLVALNYSSEEIKKILQETDFSKFLDHPLRAKEDLSSLNAIYHSFKMIAKDPKLVIEKLWNSQMGVCEGKELREWIEARVLQKTGISNCTFGELKTLIEKDKTFKHLYVYGTKIGDHPEIVQFNSEDPKWETTVISDTIRLSASIPYAFKPAKIYQKDAQGKRFPRDDLGQFVDGGLLYNFPEETFDKKRFMSSSAADHERNDPCFNTRTWAFHLVEPETEPSEEKPITNIIEFTKAMANIYLNAEQALRKLEGRDTSRSIAIQNQGIGILEFKVPKEKQELQLDSARKATKSFLKDVRVQSPGQMFPNVNNIKKKNS